MVLMFKVIKSQHVLAVDNYEASVEYFIEKLGFTIQFQVEGWSFLYLDTFYLMVGDCKGEILAKETASHSYFAYVNCEGIDGLYQQYKSNGVKFTQHISNKPWGLREFGVETPEGHRIMFGQEISA